MKSTVLFLCNPIFHSGYYRDSPLHRPKLGITFFKLCFFWTLFTVNEIILSKRAISNKQMHMKIFCYKMSYLIKEARFWDNSPAVFKCTPHVSKLNPSCLAPSLCLVLGYTINYERSRKDGSQGNTLELIFQLKRYPL